MPATKDDIVFGSLRYIDIADGLPDAVFPVKLTLKLDRTQANDAHLQDSDGDYIRPPEFPVAAKTGSHMSPYIPLKTVHFYNPVEHPNNSAETQLWQFDAFAEKMGAVERAIRSTHEKSLGRLYLQEFRLAEVPPEYVIDDGRGLDSSAYEQRAEATLATFTKANRVDNKDVRDKLGDVTAGETIQPMALSDIVEVRLKQHRGSSETTADSTKRFYFTDSQAEQYGNASLAPRKPTRVNWQYFREEMPEFAASECVIPLQYDGHKQTDTRFVEDDVHILESDDEDEEEEVVQ